MDWNTILSFQIGVLGVPLVSWQIFKISPNKAQKFIILVLNKIFKNQKSVNKVSNALGVVISKIGLDLVSDISDPEQVDIIAKLKNDITILEKKLKIKE